MIAGTIGVEGAAARAWDAIVVGAGPAGGVAAYRLARAGRRVLLVERSALPRGKVCGCCLSAAGVRALRDLGLASALHGAIPLTRVHLVAGRARAVVRVDGGVVLSREALDAAIVRAAIEAGAEFMPRTMARRTRPAGGCREVELEAVGDRGADRGRTARAGVVIAADGLGSVLLAEELPTTIARWSRFGVGATTREGGPRAGELWMHCGRAGYVGVVALEDGTTNIAAALDPVAAKRAGGPGAMVASILGGSVDRAVEPELVSGLRWHGTAALTRSRGVEAERLLAVGDASGYVEPFTGEGMGWAVASGAAAAVQAEKIAAGERVASWRGSWSARHRSLVWNRQMRCAMLAWVLRSPGLTSLAVRVVGMMPAVGGRVAGAMGRPWASAALAGGSDA
ncbi:MAG: NAD(P)/FAD-dependent oxidoreductase [Phycisphaerales bacterium]